MSEHRRMQMGGTVRTQAGVLELISFVLELISFVLTLPPSPHRVSPLSSVFSHVLSRQSSAVEHHHQLHAQLQQHPTATHAPRQPSESKGDKQRQTHSQQMVRAYVRSEHCKEGSQTRSASLCCPSVACAVLVLCGWLSETQLLTTRVGAAMQPAATGSEAGDSGRQRRTRVSQCERVGAATHCSLLCTPLRTLSGKRPMRVTLLPSAPVSLWPRCAADHAYASTPTRFPW